MITEPEVNFRKRRLRAVGKSLLGDDLGWLDRRLSNGGDSDHCNSNRNRRSDINVLLFRMVASILRHCSRLCESRL